ncbi:hypothetical protein D3C79_852100 [compost metagenome]
MNDVLRVDQGAHPGEHRRPYHLACLLLGGPVNRPKEDTYRTWGAASRPIAGKRGSHKYSADLEAGDIPVGAGLPANTGEARAIHRSACFAGKPAPTGNLCNP